MFIMHLTPLIPKIAQFLNVHSPLIISTVIAPHGMTDLIHAYENKQMQNLFRINLLCVATACLGDFMHVPQIIDACFVGASIFHFRHDMPKIQNIPQILFSTLLVLNFSKIGISMFLLYMCLIHVPNHYKHYTGLFEKHGLLLTSILANATFVFAYMTLNHADLLTSSLMDCLVKMIIVSHIVYEEVYDRDFFENMSALWNKNGNLLK